MSRTPDDPNRDRPKRDVAEGEREHAVDYADFLDALLDPDDPLHEAAKRAIEADDAAED